jgi:hypothetical protein
MAGRDIGVVGIFMLAGVSWVEGASKVSPPNAPSLPTRPQLSLDHLPASQREAIRQILERPTLCSQGPSESFLCRPEVYLWLLDHPDRAVLAWRRLGAQCVNITERGGGSFGWADGQGSEVTWETIQRGPDQRIWYAEGKVRASPLLPLVPVKVVVVHRHKEGRSAAGKPLVQHQSDVYLHTDSKAVGLVTRMLGASASRLAEQGLGQLQLFFSGLSWYLYQNPERAEALLGPESER